GLGRDAAVSRPACPSCGNSRRPHPSPRLRTARARSACPRPDRARRQNASRKCRDWRSRRPRRPRPGSAPDFPHRSSFHSRSRSLCVADQPLFAAFFKGGADIAATHGKAEVLGKQSFWGSRAFLTAAFEIATLTAAWLAKLRPIWPDLADPIFSQGGKNDPGFGSAGCGTSVLGRQRPFARPGLRHARHHGRRPEFL